MAALIFILDTLLTLVVVAFLLRVLMPLVRADFRNPLGQAVLQFTSPRGDAAAQAVAAGRSRRRGLARRAAAGAARQDRA